MAFPGGTEKNLKKHQDSWSPRLRIVMEPSEYEGGEL
jgi:hypothetical protein